MKSVAPTRLKIDYFLMGDGFSNTNHTQNFETATDFHQISVFKILGTLCFCFAFTKADSRRPPLRIKELISFSFMIHKIHQPEEMAWTATLKPSHTNHHWYIPCISVPKAFRFSPNPFWSSLVRYTKSTNQRKWLGRQHSNRHTQIIIDTFHVY